MRFSGAIARGGTSGPRRCGRCVHLRSPPSRGGRSSHLVRSAETSRIDANRAAARGIARAKPHERRARRRGRYVHLRSPPSRGGKSSHLVRSRCLRCRSIPRRVRMRFSDICQVYCTDMAGHRRHGSHGPNSPRGIGSPISSSAARSPRSHGVLRCTHRPDQRRGDSGHHAHARWRTGERSGHSGTGDPCEPRNGPCYSAREGPRTASAAPRPVCAPSVAAIARREIVSPRTLAVSALSLDTAASTDALGRRLPGVLHRHGWSSTSRITRAELAAKHRFADFRLRCTLAALPRRPPVHTPAGSAPR
jgi:hypothetical protein